MKSTFSSDKVRQLIDSTIRRNYEDENFNVTRLCDYLRTNPATLREIIIRIYGLLPKDLIENMRLQYSLHLLLFDMKIIEIAEKVGYANSRSFRTAFKKRLNIAPSEFRKMIGTIPEERQASRVMNCTRLLWG